VTLNIRELLLGYLRTVSTSWVMQCQMRWKDEWRTGKLESFELDVSSSTVPENKTPQDRLLLGGIQTGLPFGLETSYHGKSVLFFGDLSLITLLLQRILLRRMR
jgi:hypothetical protein